MSKARDEYYNHLPEIYRDGYVEKYVKELEQQKSELIDLLQQLWNISVIPQKYEEKGKIIYNKLIGLGE